MAKIVLSVRIEEEIVRKLDEAAAYLHVNRSDLVQDILSQFIRATIDDERQTLAGAAEAGGSDEAT
jgi:metal-responsive CopG/Arc/MetJ family transcriptional regulator